MLFGLSLFVAPQAPPELAELVPAPIACTDLAQVSHTVSGQAYVTTEHHYDANGERLASVTRRSDGTEVHTLYSHGPRSQMWTQIRYDDAGAHWAGHGQRILDDAGRNLLLWVARPGENRARLWVHRGETSTIREWGSTPGVLVTERGPHGPVSRTVHDAAGTQLAQHTWRYDALGRLVEPTVEPDPLAPAPFFASRATHRCDPDGVDAAAVAIR